MTALAIGVLAAIAMAVIVGWLAFWHGVSELYASVITLVLPIVCTQLLYSGGAFTGSSSGLSGFESIDLSVEAWFWTAGTLLAALAAASWVFVSSDAGQVLVAIRENEQRCQYLGLDTPRLKIILFVACAVVCAITGYVFACYSMVVSPELAGFVFGTELVIYTVLGGRATLIGPVLATIAVDYESAQLSGDYPFVWKLILGTVFVVVIVAFPRGLLPFVGDLCAPCYGCLARIAARIGRRPADHRRARPCGSNRNLGRERRGVASRGRGKALRQSQGARRHHPHGRCRRTGQSCGSERRRQDDPDALHRRRPGTVRRPHRGQRTRYRAKST